MTRLAGKSRQQIQDATKHWSRDELVDALFKAVSVEIMLSPREIAAMRNISKFKIWEFIRRGEFKRVYRHLDNNEVRIPVAEVQAWDERNKIKNPEDPLGTEPPAEERDQERADFFSLTNQETPH